MRKYFYVITVEFERGKRNRSGIITSNKKMSKEALYEEAYKRVIDALNKEKGEIKFSTSNTATIFYHIEEERDLQNGEV